MRQMPADKYNIAWFKLAEFVSRGEKERALGLYRLLIHSFNDKIFALQLEGDILMAFNDKTAIVKYEDAARHYYKHKRYAQAIAVYEHLIYLRPEQLEYRKKLIDLYLEAEKFLPIAHHICSLSDLIKHNVIMLVQLIRDYQYKFSGSIKILWYKHIISLLKSQPTESYSDLIKIIINDLVHDHEHTKEFLGYIKALDQSIYNFICEQLSQNSHLKS